MYPERVVKPGRMFRERIASDRRRAQKLRVGDVVLSGETGNSLGEVFHACARLTLRKVGPHDRRAGDVGARLGEEFRQRTHAADRCLNTIGEWLSVSQKQG